MKIGLIAVSMFALVACVGESEQPLAPAPAPLPSASPDPVSPPPAVTPPAATGEPATPPAPPPVPIGRAPFAPSDLTGLVLWLKSDAGLHLDPAGTVTGWDDQSGKKNDAKPYTNAAPSGTTVGGPSVVFEGKQALTVADSASTQFAGDFTIVVIAASSQTANSYGALFGKSAVPYPYTGPVLFTNYPHGATPLAGEIGGQIDVSNYATSTQVGLDDSAAHMFMLGRSGMKISVRVGTNAPADHDLAAAPADTKAVGVDTYIGGHPQNGVIQGFQGKIFEVVALDHAIADSDYGDLAAYATARYGIK